MSLTLHTKRYNYCLPTIKQGRPFLLFSNNIEDVEVFDKYLLYDVEFLIEESFLIIEGIEDGVYFAKSKTPLAKLPHTPLMKFIKTSPGITLFGKEFSKPLCYVEGWYRTEPKNKVRYIFKDFVIKCIED